MNSIKLNVYSIISMLLAIVSFKLLSPYTITSIYEIKIIISKVLTVITHCPLNRLYLIIGTFTAILSLIISIHCLINTNYFADEDEQSLLLLKIFLTISFLVNCIILIFSIYLLLYLIILIILILLIIPFVSFITSSEGGPVHVRGHYRKGTYVRSYTRRRPR